MNKPTQLGRDDLFCPNTKVFSELQNGYGCRVADSLQFVHKLVKNAYKITADDAQSFRDAGLNDEAYIEVFNTVAIQQSLDRLANCIGVAADPQPLLGKNNA